MKVAVDVSIGAKGVQMLRDAGHDVVCEAQHAEPDREWFVRALNAGVEVVLSPDTDLEILCYDAKVRCIRVKSDRSGVENVKRAIYMMRSWVRPTRAAV